MSDSFSVVIHTDPNELTFVDDVGHIPVNEVEVEPAHFLIDHEHFFLLGDDAYLFIVVEDVEVSCLFEGAKVVVELSFEIGIPT